ncbi:acetyl-coenzyme A synthetase [Sphingobacterium mizutaii NBRC 14946 = DSM 11724]|uniref:Acetate--CoA ligase n=2 Tax=Sphingobacterium mizutaii TaxID=1010 RepID=A0AAJ4X8W8_9SPHI|nr:acetate--CoA ligase [Sphingobacterium mizutaii]GEM67732.1 acetyl-coenzyme A synthetase [Sphingobacterium mizutaii NBRC 14946 = DSM 11724]SDL70232.1 acetyl-coenzyme A synthetase [Sphingobacterium mizutaii]SNV41891.1 Acetyl-coenzyme A synthetase [Sphingobacterium mizutaii]
MNFQLKSFEEYQEAYKRSVEEPEAFWSDVADHFFWKRKWNNVLNWNFRDPDINWFEGAKLNITENCLDRHIYKLGDQPAIIWEPNDPNEAHRILTYKQLLQKVEQFANVLKNNNIRKGDRVCIYLPMVPELVIAVLACARIGAIHNVVFGGFSARSIADRINDAECKLVITSDGGFRGQKILELKSIVDDALMQCDTVEKVIVLTRTRTPVSMIKGRDVWWEDEIKKVETQGNPACPAEEMDAEDTLFILYTSGSTGKPKGVVHSTAGYMVYTGYTFANTFQYQPGEVFFCTADIGWITGHSYIVYGPLSQGATSLMFEGIPTYPDASRFWDIVDKYKVNILYTAPTAIRSLMAFGDDFLEGKDLSSLRVLGTVGEPINEEAWNWYHDKVGHGKCPIVDTWWQTENGGHLITPIAGITKEIPGYAMLPLPGIQPCLMDENGEEIKGNDVSGNLCIKFPWPGMLRTTWGDHERCRQTYFSTYQDMYFTGDGCYRSPEGYYRITGRVDDVLNVSGHRIGTAEVENAINMHSDVVESAIVGYPHPVKGQGIYAYVIANHHIDAEKTRQDILQTVTRIIGAIAKPDIIQFVTDLPKTRSGKIMRRILRKVAEGELSNLGDTSTLQDPTVVEAIIEGAKEMKK